MKDHKQLYSELVQRRKTAESQGNKDKIKRQHKLGKLTARERVNLLFDPGSFQEYGKLTSHSGQLPKEDITPADALIAGVGRIHGRPVCVFAEDATVMGGSVGHNTFWKRMRMQEIVRQERVPFIGLFDGAGARASDMSSTAEGSPIISQHLDWARLSGHSPLLGAVMGACAGLSALELTQMELSVMVGPTSMLAAGGPPVVKTSTGVDITKEELGGPNVHAKITGMVDKVTNNDEAALEFIRKLLSYLPQNAWYYPPRCDVVVEPEGDLWQIVPTDLKKSYDMRQVINAIFDRDSFLELKPDFGDALITGLTRLDGHVVGVIANQPLVRSGAIDGPEGQKARKFIDICSAYHIPLISLADTPGVMTGPEAERRASLKHGLAAAYSLAMADVPLLTVVIRKSFGFGGALMAGYRAGQTVSLTWTTADFSSLPPDAAVEAFYGQQIKESEDPENMRKTLIKKYSAFAGPYPAASQFKTDDVIDPRETRERLALALELALSRRNKSPAPVPKYGVMP